jgi:hypothetical protein
VINDNSPFEVAKFIMNEEPRINTTIIIVKKSTLDLLNNNIEVATKTPIKPALLYVNNKHAENSSSSKTNGVT